MIENNMPLDWGLDQGSLQEPIKKSAYPGRDTQVFLPSKMGLESKLKEYRTENGEPLEIEAPVKKLLITLKNNVGKQLTLNEIIRRDNGGGGASEISTREKSKYRVLLRQLIEPVCLLLSGGGTRQCVLANLYIDDGVMRYGSEQTVYTINSVVDIPLTQPIYYWQLSFPPNWKHTDETNTYLQLEIFDRIRNESDHIIDFEAVCNSLECADNTDKRHLLRSKIYELVHYYGFDGKLWLSSGKTRKRKQLIKTLDTKALNIK